MYDLVFELMLSCFKPSYYYTHINNSFNVCRCIIFQFLEVIFFQTANMPLTMQMFSLTTELQNYFYVMYNINHTIGFKIVKGLQYVVPNT